MLVMMLPFFTIFTVLMVLPIISSIVLSFTSYDTINPLNFVGIDNYLRMFVSDDAFLIVLKNTLVLVLLTGPVGFILAFLLAWLVNEFTPRVRTIFSFMFYAPSLAGNAFMVWKIIFSGDSYGYLNSFLLNLGLITEPITWLNASQYLMGIIVLVQLWQSMGISFLSNIAGLQNVSRDLYEAGAIDGIRNRVDPPKPMEKNLFLLSSNEIKMRKIKSLPRNMFSALENFEKSLLSRAALGDYIFEEFLKTKRKEWKLYRKQVTPWEIKNYMDV